MNSIHQSRNMEEECKMIEELTGFFRTGTDPFWKLLRKLMNERGIDPNTSLLAFSAEDNVNFQFGILVTYGRRVIQYAVQCTDSSFEGGEITKWEELTEIWSASGYRHEISTALSLLEKMELIADEVSKIIETELGKIKNPQSAELIRKLLVPLRCEVRQWEYDAEGSKYPCWIFAEHQESDTVFAYCEHGFGPDCPWGLLGVSRAYPNMGMDSNWFDSLEDLVRDSQAWPDAEQKS